MKYVILIRSDPAGWAHLMARFTALIEEVARSGELVDSAPLADPITTRSVRVRDEVLSVTAGPFAAAEEHLAGYFVVDCEGEQRAIEIAARFLDARSSAVEVRPIMEMSGLEM